MQSYVENNKSRTVFNHWIFIPSRVDRANLQEVVTSLQPKREIE